MLFDLPRVVENAPALLAQAGVDERCQIIGGNFFESLPGGSGAYLLSNVLHDWQDGQATAILRTVHRAMAGRGRLVVVNEHVILYQTVFRQFDMGYASTIADLIFLVVLVVTILQMRLSRYWVFHE